MLTEYVHIFVNTFSSLLSEKEVKIVLPDDCVFGHEERAVNLWELNFTPSVDQRNRPEKVQKKVDLALPAIELI